MFDNCCAFIHRDYVTVNVSSGMPNHSIIMLLLASINSTVGKYRGGYYSTGLEALGLERAPVAYLETSAI